MFIFLDATLRKYLDNELKFKDGHWNIMQNSKYYKLTNMQ